MGFLEILTVIFVWMKLSGRIDWSWWWVTCPLWIELALAVAGVVIFALLSLFSLI